MKHRKTPNNPHDLWNVFQKTGRISAYLAYKKALKESTGNRDGLG